MCLLGLQDNFAVQSFERGIAAQESGAFKWEIVPVEVSGGRGRPSTIVDKDEGPGKVVMRVILEPSLNSLLHS